MRSGFAILLILSVTSSDAQDDPTLESVLLQYCRSDKFFVKNTITGPIGPPGLPGIRGRRGYNGPQGPMGPLGMMNKNATRESFEKNLEAVFRTTRWAVTHRVKLESCQDIQTYVAPVTSVESGVYEIYLPTSGWTNVYCDFDVDEGGWTVFQRRMDGSVDFFRGWEDYKYGFGDRNGEFWLGLDKVHQMTENGVHELRIDMMERDGTHYYAKYRKFHLSPSADHYRLHVQGYSGNATDSLELPLHSKARHNGRQFSTKDADHDRDDSGNCAEDYKGGWWYDDCHHSNLNGQFGEVSYKGIRWRDQGGGNDMYMRYTEMKFRRNSTAL